MKSKQAGKHWYSLGLIGYPLDQSLSPRLHSAALKALELKGDYLLYPISPDEQMEEKIAALISRIRSREISGLNVTIPHKQTVISHMDVLTPQAAAIGAVNTINLDGSRVIGDNTDAPAFIEDLKRVSGISLIGNASGERDNKARKALILGGGGAARAVVYALWQAGWHVGIASRRLDQSHSIVNGFRDQSKNDHELSRKLEAIPLLPPELKSFISDLERRCLIIVNASSAGMVPNVQESAWPGELAFPPNAFVYDLVYKPKMTAFMTSACKAGLEVSNGLGMLVEQAALALERWTAMSVPREVMWQAINDVHTDELSC